MPFILLPKVWGKSKIMCFELNFYIILVVIIVQVKSKNKVKVLINKMPNYHLNDSVHCTYGPDI